MKLRDAPITKKLMISLLLTSGASLLFTCVAYFGYEFFTFRQTMVLGLSTLGEIVAANSTAALAFDSPGDAMEILSALKAEKHIQAAGLYDERGNLFSHYPADLSVDLLPVRPDDDGYRFEGSYLSSFQPVMLKQKRLGSLYLRSDMGALTERIRFFLVIVISVLGVSFFVAYLFSRSMQRTISQPVLALAATARAISSRKDYTVRATKTGQDELGDLTDAFNQMLTQIEDQNVRLRRHQETLENIVESMGDAYVSFDEHWVYTFANNKALLLMGKTKEMLIGKSLWAVFPDTRGTIFETEYRSAMEQRVATSFEVFYPPYDMWLEVRAYPHENGIAVFYTDITKYRRAEEEIRSLNASLEQKVLDRTSELKAANEELESFSYSVSHDLRAPLRSIHGYMKIFSEDYSEKVDDQGRRLIGIVLANAKQMGKLIDELLEFSRLGRRELSRTNIVMREVVASTWDEHLRMEGERHLEFRLGHLPIAFADSTTIRQVWANLISNALKYTRGKAAVIEIGFHEEGGDVIYFVKDNGAGFDMKYYDKLFGVFQRLHKVTEFEGTGVGLAIVHRIISKHGGKIWADAKSGEGATFYFSLGHAEDSSERA